MIPALQMIADNPAPVFPRRIATRSLPTRHLAAVVQRSIPVLRSLEKVVHPRWHTPLRATKRLVGAVVLVLSMTLVFSPIPLSNVVPALLIVLISIAYLEGDEVLLLIGIVAAVMVMAIATVAVWELIVGANGSPTSGNPLDRRTSDHPVRISRRISRRFLVDTGYLDEEATN